MFSAYIKFWKDLILSIPFTLFDYVLFLIFCLYIFEDISFGLIASGISFISTVGSFFTALAIYPLASKIFSHFFHFPKGISDAVAFLVLSAISFLIFSTIFSILRKKYVFFTPPKFIDVMGGAIFGSLSFVLIASFAIALLLSFPTSPTIRNSIKNSYTASFLIYNTQGLEHDVRKVFGGAIEDTINFLTVEPGSNESVSLNFKTTTATIDRESEAQMITLVNLQRKKQGAAPLEVDSSLRDVARAHAKDMLARGYFSHYTPNGLSPFDRMAADNINYQYAGENLAFAPDVNIAMSGLMKSPGHRENILNPNFRRVGIGVLDAGVYGKMFVQEFTD